MLLTLLEIPVVALYYATRKLTPMLKRLIKKMNRSRRKTLDRYGRDKWVWEDYDGEEDEYVYLERHRAISNSLCLLLLIILIGGSMILNHFGITLD